MKLIKKILGALMCLVFMVSATGCSSVTNGKRIVRVATMQSETHPEYLGLLKFKEYVEKELGDKYEVQIFPNEILGAAQKSIELTQTGAIDFTIVGTANLETFASVYEIFSMPYLFTSEDAYHEVMNDTDYMNKIFSSTDEQGFRALTWYNAGTRNFYAKKEIDTPDDMKGLKIRVQQSPASVAMCQAFGAAASPMSFGEVYTAIQQGVIDGAENNELALTSNKHGEVAKYFSYNKHQMIPDLLIGNLSFLNGLSKEEREVFYKAAELSNKEECKQWDVDMEKRSEKLAQAFMQYKEGELSKEAYIEMKDDRNSWKEFCEERKKSLEQTIRKLEKQQKEEARFLRSLLELDGTTRINAELAESLIKSMYLYGDGRLEINFGFKGAVEHE